MVANMEVDKVSDNEVDTVSDNEVDIVADKELDIDIDMEIQFCERVGHGAWLMVNWAQTFLTQSLGKTSHKNIFGPFPTIYFLVNKMAHFFQVANNSNLKLNVQKNVVR